MKPFHWVLVIANTVASGELFFLTDIYSKINFSGDVEDLKIVMLLSNLSCWSIL
jgi:hypothetical protein